MRILLDECVDQRFRTQLSGHQVFTVPEAGWAGKRNGELLTLAQHQFDVFITVDRNLYFQQNLSKFKIVVLILKAKTNKLADLQPLGPQVLMHLSRANVGEPLTIEISL